MADVKISELPAVVTPADTDEFETNQAGTSKMETRAQIVAGSATAAQGTLADNALQPGDIGSTVQGWDADLDALAAAGNSGVLAATTASFLTADETKLDGIEAGATADQSAAEILAALITVDGAASGLDADLLDGQQAAAFQPVDADLTALAALTAPATKLDRLEALADSQETADFTFALGDEQSKMVRANHATVAITATVPPNSSVAFPIGSIINLTQWGAAAVDVAAGVGVTINQPASKTLVIAEQYGVATLWKQGTDTWLLFGHLTAV